MVNSFAITIQDTNWRGDVSHAADKNGDDVIRSDYHVRMEYLTRGSLTKVNLQESVISASEGAKCVGRSDVFQLSPRVTLGIDMRQVKGQYETDKCEPGLH
jgi:hypothetical protein